MEFGKGRKLRRAKPAGPPRTLPELLASHERILIIQALSRSGGGRAAAAKILGISRNNLWTRITALGIDMAVFPRAKSPGRPMKNDV